MTRKQLIHESVPFSITYYDLRALLFWATIGVVTSKSGSYPDVEEVPGDPGIIRSYAQEMRFSLPYKPVFGSQKQQLRDRTKD